MEGKNIIHKGRIPREGIYLLKSSRQRVIRFKSKSEGDGEQKRDKKNTWKGHFKVDKDQ